MEKKWKVVSKHNSTSQQQSPGCTSHPCLPTSHEPKHNPDSCKCYVASWLLPIATLPAPPVGSSRHGGSELPLPTSATGSTDVQCAGKLCATKSVSQGMTPTSSHSPAYGFSLLRANSGWQLLKKSECLVTYSGKCGMSGQFSSCLLSIYPKLMSVVSSRELMSHVPSIPPIPTRN